MAVLTPRTAGPGGNIAPRVVSALVEALDGVVEGDHLLARFSFVMKY